MVMRTVVAPRKIRPDTVAVNCNIPLLLEEQSTALQAAVEEEIQVLTKRLAYKQAELEIMKNLVTTSKEYRELTSAKQ